MSSLGAPPPYHAALRLARSEAVAARAQSEEDRGRLHAFEDEARRHAAEAVGEIAELEARVANLTAEASRARGGGKEPLEFF